MIEEHTSRNSFVARIWLEQGSNGYTSWRGHLRHVQSEEEGYFQDLMGMREFLGRVSGVTGPALTAQPLKDATKSQSSANPKSATVTNIKQKDWSEQQIQPTGQPAYNEVTNVSDAPQSLQPKDTSLQPGDTSLQFEDITLQPEPRWGVKLFYTVLLAVLVFFWWLLIYSGGMGGSHG